MRNALIRWTVAIASFLYGGRKYVTRGSLKANLGCGLLCVPGWINIDGSLTALLGSRRFAWWNRVIYRLAGSSAYYSFDEFNRIIRACNLCFADLRRGVPLRDNSADLLFASHFLEHLTKEDGRRFLRECHRALKPGGLMRLIVPDLDVAFAMYQEGKVEEMLGLFFYNSEKYDFSAHKYNYNFELLKRSLEEAGFTSVQKRAYREGECPDIEMLDVYPEHSLYVECRK